MQTEKELTEAISELTLEIQERYPEMSKYIGEMTVTNPDKAHPDINRKVLQNYYDNLVSMIHRYAEEHGQASSSEIASLQDEKL